MKRDEAKNDYCKNKGIPFVRIPYTTLKSFTLKDLISDKYLINKEVVIMSTNRKIYVVGDTHGDIDFHKLNSKFFREGKKLTKDDYVIICGDFGGVWDKGEYDKYVQNWYNERPWTTLFVDG